MINMEMKDWAMLGAFVALSLYPVYGNPKPAIKELWRFLTFAMGVIIGISLDRVGWPSIHDSSFWFGIAGLCIGVIFATAFVYWKNRHD